MKDIRVEIGLGRHYVAVMVTQGHRSKHVPGGMRVIDNAVIEHDLVIPRATEADVLGLVGAYWVKKYGGLVDQDQLPFS